MRAARPSFSAHGMLVLAFAAIGVLVTLGAPTGPTHAQLSKVAQPPPPPATIIDPDEGQTVSGTFLLRAGIEVGAASLSFTVSGGDGDVELPAIAENVEGTSWVASWDTTFGANGAYAIVAHGALADDRTYSSDARAVNVQNVALEPPGEDLTVSLTSPTPGATVSGTVALAATTNVAASSVSFVITPAIGGSPVVIAATGAGTAWTAAWDTTAFANGDHTLKATATNADGEAESTTIGATVQNAAETPLTVALTSPPAGAALSGSVNLSASTSVAATSLTFVVRNAATNAVLSSFPATASAGGTAWTAAWNTASAADGSYVVRAIATKEAQTVQSEPAAVTVSNAAPEADGGDGAVTATVTAPSPAQNVHGTINLSATTSVAVASLSFTIAQQTAGGVAPVNVAAVGNHTGTAWTASWDAATVPNGAYAIVAKAPSGAGQVQSAAVSFTVQNIVISATIVAPAAAATVGNTVELVAATVPTASALTFRIVGVTDPAIVSERTSTLDVGRQAWVAPWDTRDFPNGNYRIEAAASDAAGKKFAAQPVGVKVDNGNAQQPGSVEFSVQMRAPLPGATVAGTVPFAAQVGGGPAVAVSFFIANLVNTINLKIDAAFDAARGLWVGHWDSRPSPNGEYRVGAVATNASNAKTESARTGFIVRNDATQPPPSDQSAPLAAQIIAPLGGNVDGSVEFVVRTEGLPGRVTVAIRLRGESAPRASLEAVPDAERRHWKAVWNAGAAPAGTYDAAAIATSGAATTNSNVVTLFIERQTSGTTAPPPPTGGTAEPAVLMVHPAPGAAVRGASFLSARTTFPASALLFTVRGPDGAVVHSRQGVFAADRGAWVAPWDTTRGPDGQYVVRASARDASGTERAAEARISVANSSVTPVESVPAIPQQIVREIAETRPPGTVPLPIAVLPPRVAEAAAVVGDRECAAAGIPKERCPAWLASRHQATECRQAGIVTKEECVSHLQRVHGGQLPECRELDAQGCADVIGLRTSGLLLAADLAKLEETLAPRIGTHFRLAPPPDPTDATGDGTEAAEEDPLARHVPLKPRRELALRLHASPHYAQTDDETSHRNVPAVLLFDRDDDGLPDDAERRFRTNPDEPDTDGDGFSDGEEVRNGYNPLGRGRLVDGIALAPIDVAIVSGAPLEQPKSAGEVSDDLGVGEVVAAEPAAEGEEPSAFVITGTGTPGEIVTLFMYSYLPVVMTTEVNDDGTWSYEMDAALSDGEHEVYVTVTDETGKIKKKSRPLAFFVAQAQAATPEEFFEEQPGSAAQALAAAQEPSKLFLGWYVAGAAVLIAIAGLAVFLLFRGKKPQRPSAG